MGDDSRYDYQHDANLQIRWFSDDACCDRRWNVEARKTSLSVWRTSKTTFLYTLRQQGLRAGPLKVTAILRRKTAEEEQEVR